MKRSYVFLAILLVAGCTTPLLQTPPPHMSAQVRAPEIRVGDEWKYSVHDGYTKLPRGTLDYRVNSVQGDNVTVEVRQEQRQWTELYTRDWNWRERPMTNQPNFRYQPAYTALPFPLEAGKTWKARLTATNPVDGRRFPITIDGAIVGWERVKVPAGEFDALKIERTVYFDYWEQGVRGQSRILEYEWYAPAARQTVRREASSRYFSYLGDAGGENGGLRFVRTKGGKDDGGGPRFVLDDWLKYELVSYPAR